MDNYTEIIINDKPVKLVFGMIANEYFLKLQEDRDFVNNTLVTAEILYSAAVNASILDRTKKPVYAEFIDGIDKMYESEQGLQFISDALEVYNVSRFGINMKRVADIVKKNADESQNPSVGNKLEDLPTVS